MLLCVCHCVCHGYDIVYVIAHSTSSPPFFSAQFQPTVYQFGAVLSSRGRNGSGGKKPMQPTQQINITWCARSGQSYRVRNWHVAGLQLRIALVRCPRCNKMQLWERKRGGAEINANTLDGDLQPRQLLNGVHVGWSSDRLERSCRLDG